MHETIGEVTPHITSGAVTVALLIFLGTYGVIIWEKIHRTIIAFFGGALMGAWHINGIL